MKEIAVIGTLQDYKDWLQDIPYNFRGMFVLVQDVEKVRGRIFIDFFLLHTYKNVRYYRDVISETKNRVR